MRTIIWKEMRENFRWALLGLFVSGCGMWMTLGSSNRLPMFPGQFDATHILSSDFLVMTTVGGALFAGLMGFMQVIFDTRPDQWAFLVHRPIPRTQIFFGKTIAGLALYILGFGIPLLIVVVHASRPGSFPAPFEWRMALPAFADLLNGVVYYFAGMLTGLRQARWYGSRCLGILAAVCATFGVEMVSSFWIATLVSVAAIGLSSLAAWGSFLSGGRYSNQPLLGKFALTAFLAPGALTTLMTGVVFVGIAAAQTRMQYREYSYYQLMKDGSVLKITTENSFVIDASHLDGTPFRPSASGGTGGLGQVSQQFLPTGKLTVEARRSFGSESYRSWRTYFAPLPATAEAIWCYSRTLNRILGYSVSTRRLVGSIGPNGFLAGKTGGPDQFQPPDSGIWTYAITSGDLLHFRDGVYRLALEERKVIRLFAAAEGDSVISSTALSVDGRWEFVAIATTEWIQVVTMDGRTVFRIKNVHHVDEYGVALVGKLPKEERFVLHFKPSYFMTPDRRAELPESFQLVSSDGTVLSESVLPLLPPPANPGPALEAAIGSAIPPVVIVPLQMVTKISGQPFQPIATLLSIAVGLVCAAGSVGVSRRFAFSNRRTFGWALFNGLFGVPGLITFFSVHEWPLRELCASCGKLRVTNREDCEHCGAGFPRPERDGTEIFEPVQGSRN